MSRPTRAGGVVPLVPLEARLEAPLYEQLYAGLRREIVAGRLAPGTRIASSRVLAIELGVSRFTAASAVDQLAAEGYVVSLARRGTFVARTLPERRLVARKPATRPPPRPHDVTTGATTDGEASPRLSSRGAALSRIVITGPRSQVDEPRPFRPRRPPLDAFPFTPWAQLVRRQWRNFRHGMLDYGEPAGYQALREAIALHVRTTRGVACTADEVVVTSGGQQAFDLLFRLLLDPGDEAWIEEPGYLDVRGALVAAGARLVPVPVDGEGLDVAAGERLAPSARLAYVSPSHQYPTGATLSVPRRRALLAWAARTGAWIVEDDYDSYFRYRGRPLPALQSLDPSHVAYVGTFSKTMFPSLRVGFCVVPPALVDAVANARAVASRNGPLVDQAALAAFIDEGHYDRHLRRVRAVCVERHEALRHHLARRLDGALEVTPAAAGTHVVATPTAAVRRAADGIPRVEEQIAAAAAEAGLVVFPVSRYCLTSLAAEGIVLGYGGLAPLRIAAGVERLATVIDRLAR